MASSIASQLQAIKSFIQTDSEPAKRPFTRPSILFSPKEAADIDIDTIYSISLSGLEVLVDTDERFRNYKNDLFSHKSKELDRELMTAEENDRINVSISSYLRLLSGYFQLLSSHRTLEYLIRRYKVHVYNVEELILCSLPYHDTPAFVRVVQLINFGNTKWKFLDAVKASGAPPPRWVIVQQCTHDLGVLETVCGYASPIKKFQPPSPVISFCTAVVIEVVGSFMAVDSDVVKRIIPFVVSGLQPGMKGGSEQKASALMIVGLLANKAALSPKLVNSLIRSITEIARENAKDSTDLRWFRLVLMALINLIQGQSTDLFPKKALEVLKEMGDISGILLGLSREFNIDRFLAVLLASMVDYSSLDDSFLLPLVSIIESVPIDHIVGSLITKILNTCFKLSQKAGNCPSPDLGIWAKKILVVVMKKYPSELHGAIRKFLETTRMQLGKEELVSDTLSKLLAGSQEVSLPLLDSKIWLSLHHPKAEVRRAALSGLNTSEILKARAVDSQGFETIQDALLRQLHDDDLTVVRAALSINNLSEIISRSNFVQALLAVLQRCVRILLSSSTEDIALVGDIVVLCLKCAHTRLNDSPELSEELTALIFPLLLIMPKTLKCNLKALEVAKEVHWPLYQNLSSIAVPETKLQSGAISPINLKIVNCLADAFMTNPQELMPSLVENSNDFMISKTLFLLVLMQSIVTNKKGNHSSDLLEACFHVLKTQWGTVNCSENIDVGEGIGEHIEYDCCRFLDELFDTNVKEINGRISICIFWRLLRACTTDAPLDLFQGENEKWAGKLQELFAFFALSNVNNIFSNHLHHLINNCKKSPPVFLSQFFTEEAVPVKVQMESLHGFAFLCSQSEEPLQLLAEFPSLLVPLASENQDVRTAAMSCVEVLYALCSRVDLSGKRNGNIMIWSRFVDELLGLLVQQKRLILSDRNFLAAFLTSLICPPASGSSLLVPLNTEKRFDESTKKEILNFILGSTLKLSLYGKLIILSLVKGMGSTLLCVNEVELLLSLLSKRRCQYYFERDNSSRLSKTEVDILCLLLEICTMPASSRSCASDDHLLKALQLKGISLEEPALVLPCITVLNNLNNRLFCGLNSETQESLFCELVFLYRNDCGDIQKATTEALLQLDVSWSILVKMFDSVFQQEFHKVNTKKKKKLRGSDSLSRQHHLISEGESILSFLGSLLDIFLMKKSTANREYLVEPLFRLLGKLFSDDWLHVSVMSDQVDIRSEDSQMMSVTTYFIQQTLLLVLEDIVKSTNDKQSMDVLREKVDIVLLVNCAHSCKDGATRNHIFSLLSTIAKVMPDRFLDHIEDVLHVLGESAVTQIDGHSQHVFEELVSSVVPCWLSKTNNMDQPLQIFVNVLPEVAEHRRLSIITYLMRALGESDSLGSLLFILFQSLITRKNLDQLVNSTSSFLEMMTLMQAEWEYAFAVQICGHYSCVLWLPSLVILLAKIGHGSSTNHLFLQLLLAMHFISDKLGDPEFIIMLDSMEALHEIQGSLQELLERVVPLWQLTDARKKLTALPVYLRKELKDCMHSVLVTITKAMIPLSYFKGMIKLLSYTDENVRRKALGILSETMRYQDTMKPKRRVRGESSTFSSRNWLYLEKGALEACHSMCLNIVQLIDNPENESDIPLRLAAVSAIEALANRFPTEHSIFSSCLLLIAKGIGSSDRTFSSSCLRTSGTLINVLGPKALQHLPTLMEKLIKASCDMADNVSAKSSSSRDFLLSVLTLLEAVVDKLGGFLNPYLENIMKLLVLHSDFTSGSDVKLTSRSRAIRKLVTEKIPVRLALPTLLRLYATAVASGDSSLTIMFEMISSLVASMDRPSVSAYHAKIYDACLQSLDLRCQCLLSIKNIGIVEKSIIEAMVALTMKLTETMFKPMFIRTIEWAESEVEKTAKGDRRNVDRAISFYGLVNKLAENHRSLFVPYFKYLTETSVLHLTDLEQLSSSGLMHKKKKTKVLESSNDGKETDSGQAFKKWHLRALVLSALYKCFLYDIGSLKYLDSSTFQVLLKPIVSQLVTEPPARLEDFPDVPSLHEVDDLVVNCIGQMAVTAGSDLLWKPLNHEVLMQTRSEKVRSRLLALRVVEYLLENLKEEYLVLLAETIPFLGELLEDVELPVRSLAQEILKEMESMSGESLRQYL